MSYKKETYLAEWAIAYEQVIAQSMDSLSTGKDTPMEKLFKLIDETSRETSQVDRLSLKKDAYMSLIQSITVASQKTAMELVDKKFTAHIGYEMAEKDLVAKDKDLELKDSQKALTERQAKSYDDDRDQKVLNTAVNGHAMIFEALQGSDFVPVVPKYYTGQDELDALFENAMKSE